MTLPTIAAARCPALLIAAPASGQGKTTVTAGPARVDTRKGLEGRVLSPEEAFAALGQRRVSVIWSTPPVRIAQQAAHRLGVAAGSLAALQHLGPGTGQAHQHAAHRQALEQELVQLVAGHQPTLTTLARERWARAL